MSDDPPDVIREGPAHLIPLTETVIDLPPQPEGEQWVLDRRVVPEPEKGK